MAKLLTGTRVYGNATIDNVLTAANVTATGALSVGANVIANNTTVFVGNSSVNTVITAGQVSISGIAVNSTSYPGTANNATNLGGVAAASYVQNTDSRTLSGNLVFTGANVFLQSASLGGTATNFVNNFIINTNVGNASYLRFYHSRHTTGADWTGASTRIQQRIDVTDMGYLEFNPSGYAQGIALYGSSGSGLVVTQTGNVVIGTTVNTQISNSTILLSNSTTTTTVSLSDIRIGNSTVNAVANSTVLIFNGPINSVAGLYKPSANGSRFEFTYAGSNNASTPFWNGYHFAAPGTFANSSAGSNYPRASHFYSFTSTSNPSDLYYNIQVGNDGNIGTGIKIYSTNTSGTQGGIDIAANGNVGVGTTTPIAKIQSSADVAAPFFIAPTTISANYTIPTNYNAMTPGPVTVNTSVTVTVPSGSTWTIV